MREVTVTQVLKRLQDYGHIDPKVLENKGLIGKDVHSAIEASITGNWFPLAEERRVAYFDSYAKWSGIKDYEYKITEKRYYDRDLFLSGQVDAVVSELETDTLMLLDFKTSAKEPLAKDGMSIWSMQGHLYHHLLKKNGIDIGNRIIFLQLTAKKTIDGYIGTKPKEYYYDYDQVVMDRCLELVHQYWEEFDSAVDHE